MNLTISRRQFLEKTGKGLLVTSMSPLLFKTMDVNAMNNKYTEDLKIKDYLDHFGIHEALMREVMSEALSKGGDYCDLYFQHGILNYIGLEDNDVNRAYTNIDYGVGIRVLKGEQTGFSFTEDLSPKAMKQAAQTAANIADSGKSIDPAVFSAYTPPNYYPIITPWEKVSIEEKIPFLQKINDKVFALDDRIIKTNIAFINESGFMLYANSEGKLTFDYQPMGLIYVNCIAEQNGQRENNSFNLAARSGIEFFTPENIDKLATEAVSRTVTLFDAVKPDGGEMEVVLAAGSSGILLHEAIGHGLEADFNRKEISIFSDKMNKPIAKDFVTIVDNGTNQNIRGSINVDDEGNETENTVLVENGKLRSYIHDRLSARHYNVKPTGNGRRQSFRYAPLPRMRNTYMLNGPHKKDEIIRSVKKGLYAETFTNGQVYIGGGDFTFYVKSGFMIEDGKLTKPVKDINIIGNGPEVLSNITMVADDFKMAEGGWTCGKNGQGVPVSQGLPTVKVSKITVGGV